MIRRHDLLYEMWVAKGNAWIFPAFNQISVNTQKAANTFNIRTEIMEFTFTTTNETYEYCCEVVNCLTTYCKKSQEEALSLVNAYWHEQLTFDEQDFRLHEYPYYWAMCMTDHYIQGEIRRDWWHDPQLWPAPKEYLQKYNY